MHNCVKEDHCVEKKTRGKHDFQNDSLRFDLHKIVAGHRAKENRGSWAVTCFRLLAHKSNHEESGFYQVGLSVISYIGLCTRVAESTFDRCPVFGSKADEDIIRGTIERSFYGNCVYSGALFCGHVFLCN